MRILPVGMIPQLTHELVGLSNRAGVRHQVAPCIIGVPGHTARSRRFDHVSFGLLPPIWNMEKYLTVIRDQSLAVGVLRQGIPLEPTLIASKPLREDHTTLCRFFLVSQLTTPAAVAPTITNDTASTKISVACPQKIQGYGAPIM